MTPQELKNSILQLAIQGKLVEQRPEEGTAAELLEKILAERYGTNETRGTNGTAKTNGTKRRASSVSEVSSVSDVLNVSGVPSDEKPFDIPESWEWVRLGDCTSYAAKKEKVLSADIQPDEWSLDLEDIEKDTGRIIEFRSAKDRRIVGEKVVFHKGQILYSKLRPYLKKILVAPNDGICTPELVPFSALGGIDARYVVVVLKSPHVDFLINSVTYGVKMPRVGTETMINLPIPLPPLAEQKRIVAKIEELMPLVDRYEKAWSRLEDFNKRFPADMQKSLLQLAIQGKLVEQRAEEGTGAELLEKILAAKNAEGAKGKGEKSHAKSAKSAKVGSCVSREEIPDDEKPFDIPESWEWARLGEVFAHNTGKAMNSSAKFSHKVGAIRKFITTSNLYWGSFDFANVKEMFFSEEELPRCTVTKNDILVCEGGAYYGRTAIWNYDYDMCFQNHIHRLRSYVKVEEKYFYYVFRLYRETGMMKSQGTAMPGLSSKVLHELTIPLPPLAEQKRIVAKLEELLPLCERLKSESNSAANS